MLFMRRTLVVGIAFLFAVALMVASANASISVTFTEYADEITPMDVTVTGADGALIPPIIVPGVEQSIVQILFTGLLPPGGTPLFYAANLWDDPGFTILSDTLQANWYANGNMSIIFMSDSDVAPLQPIVFGPGSGGTAIVPFVGSAGNVLELPTMTFTFGDTVITVNNDVEAIPEPVTLIIWSLLGTLAITIRRKRAA